MGVLVVIRGARGIFGGVFFFRSLITAFPKKVFTICFVGLCTPPVLRGMRGVGVWAYMLIFVIRCLF